MRMFTRNMLMKLRISKLRIHNSQLCIDKC
jgi:hypothetical protein